MLAIQLQSELDGKNDLITELEIKVSSLEEQVKNLTNENEELKMYKEAEDSTTQGSNEEEKKEEKDKIDLSQVEAISQDLVKKKEAEFLMKRKEDLKKFKKMHAEMMLKKEIEYKAILEDADKLIFEQEKEVESLQRKIKDYEEDIQEFEENIKENEKEKEEFNSRIIEINQENEDLKSLLENQKEEIKNIKQNLGREVALSHKEHENKLKAMKKKYILDKGNKIREIEREWTLKWEKKKNELELLSIKKEIEEFFMNIDAPDEIFKSEIKNS